MGVSIALDISVDWDVFNVLGMSVNLGKIYCFRHFYCFGAYLFLWEYLYIKKMTYLLLWAYPMLLECTLPGVYLFALGIPILGAYMYAETLLDTL